MEERRTLRKQWAIRRDGLRSRPSDRVFLLPPFPRGELSSASSALITQNVTRTPNCPERGTYAFPELACGVPNDALVMVVL